jgi:hypothetical protein
MSHLPDIGLPMFALTHVEALRTTVSLAYIPGTFSFLHQNPPQATRSSLIGGQRPWRHLAWKSGSRGGQVGQNRDISRPKKE